jgi:hypothetical protein
MTWPLLTAIFNILRLLINSLLFLIFWKFPKFSLAALKYKFISTYFSLALDLRKQRKTNFTCSIFVLFLLLFPLGQNVEFSFAHAYLSLCLVLFSWAIYVTLFPLSTLDLCLHLCSSFHLWSPVRSNTTQCNILQFKTSITYLLHSGKCWSLSNFGNEKCVGETPKGILKRSGSLLIWHIFFSKCPVGWGNINPLK